MTEHDEMVATIERLRTELSKLAVDVMVLQEQLRVANINAERWRVWRERFACSSTFDEGRDWYIAKIDFKCAITRLASAQANVAREYFFARKLDEAADELIAANAKWPNSFAKRSQNVPPPEAAAGAEMQDAT